MEDIVGRMRAEEAELVRKLEAVRQFLEVYGGDEPKPQAQGAKGSRRGQVSRKDKFGAYGKSVIDAALRVLPGPDGSPVMTRALVGLLELHNVEIRGENKVNALSALLARSSMIKGHGRAGWTKAELTRGEALEEMMADDGQKEIEASSGDSADASIVSGSGGPTPGSAAWVNPQSGWPS